jgi:N-acyl-D-amino-acid deacylase
VPATLVIRGGTVIDGTGAAPRRTDVVIDGDRIVEVGDAQPHIDAEVVDATGYVVAPGFINVLSHAWGSVQRDATAASDLVQGVTTEVFGEAFSLGPSDGRLTEAMRPWADLGEDARVEFTRLSQGLDHVERLGIVPNIASFIGGMNLRILGAGFDDRALTATELDTLRGIVEEEMQEGALGIGTALIYPPGWFARTDELIALSEVVGRYDGTYISHLRSEGDRFLECLEELLTIGREAQCRAEVYHLKAAGRPNWHKMQLAIDRIEGARAAGQAVAANMYPYTAGGTALSSSIPARFHVGGPQALLDRLKDPTVSAEMAAEMRKPSDKFENLFLAAGGGDGILFFDDLADGTPARGRRLSDLAADFGLDDADALLEVVRRDPGQGVAYFIIDEDNVRLGLSQPWVSIGSDAQAHAAVSPFIEAATHPRTYGTFARVLGRYCRDEGLFPLTEAVRRMTSLPADNFALVDRGRLVPGAFADLVVFDAETVGDTATYEQPHQCAVGVRDVVVNGTVVLRDRQFTPARPGRRLRRGR